MSHFHVKRGFAASITPVLTSTTLHSQIGRGLRKLPIGYEAKASATTTTHATRYQCTRPCRTDQRITRHAITMSTEVKYTLRTCIRGAGSKAKTTSESQATT